MGLALMVAYLSDGYWGRGEWWVEVLLNDI